MRYRTVLAMLLLGGFTLWAAPAAAQQQQEMAEAMAAWQKAGQPGVPHQQLAKLVGTWKSTAKMWMDPAGEPMVMPGTVEYRMIMDGRFLEENVSSEFMGQPFSGRGLYGYDNVTGKLVATWIDNMSTGIYLGEGTINEAGDEMVLHGSYTDPLTKEETATRSGMRISDTELTAIAYETVDGQEQKMMEITAWRKKP